MMDPLPPPIDYHLLVRRSGLWAVVSGDIPDYHPQLIDEMSPAYAFARFLCRDDRFRRLTYGCANTGMTTDLCKPLQAPPDRRQRAYLLRGPRLREELRDLCSSDPMIGNEGWSVELYLSENDPAPWIRVSAYDKTEP